MTFAVKWQIQAIDQFSQVARNIKAANLKMARSFRDASKDVEKFNKRIADSAKKAVGVGKSISKKISLPVAGAGLLMLRTATNFEKAMANVAATADSSVEDFERQRRAAIRAGSETAFSHTQAAQAMEALAMAGRNVSEQEKMLIDTLDLAAAGNLGLSEAATILNATLSTFSKPADEARDVVNKLAKASAIADTNVAMFAQSLKNVGAEANLSQQSFETTTAALGVLASTNLKTGKGGTALMRTMADLRNPTDKARVALDQIGVKTRDADGNMRHLADILGEIKHVMETAPRGKDFNELLPDIFTDVGIRGAFFLMQNMEQFIQAEKELIEQTAGAGAKMAQRRLEGVAGAMQMLGSASQDVAIQLFDEETMKSIERQIQKFRDNIVSPFADLLKENPAFRTFILSFGTFLALLGPAVALMGQFVIGLAAMKFLGFSAIGLAALAGKFLLVAGAIALVVANMEKLKPIAKNLANDLMPKGETPGELFKSAAMTPYRVLQRTFSGAADLSMSALDFFRGRTGSEMADASMSSFEMLSTIDLNIRDKGNNIESVSTKSPSPLNVNLGSNINAVS